MKFVITVDTDSKEITVKAGSEIIDNVSSVSISKHEDCDHYCDSHMIFISSDSSTEDMKRFTSIMASCKEAKIEQTAKAEKPWISNDTSLDEVSAFLDNYYSKNR